jgi:copper transport protein
MPALAVALALALAPSASAHARLIDTKPAAGGTLGTAPSEVQLLFDDPVGVAAGNDVVGSDRRSVLGGNPRLRHRDRELVLPLRTIGNGDYTVGWKIVSDDGHLESGVFAFRVGATDGAADLPRPVLAAASTRPGAMDVLARFLYLGGILLAGGAALFYLLVSRSGGRRLATTISVALGVAVVGGAWLLHATHGGATRFDHVVELALFVGAAGAVVAALARPYPRLLPLALAASLALLAAPTLAGHALGSGEARPLSVVADLFHVVAAAFWTGGLLQLALLLRGGPDERVVRRFSLLALPAVALIALSGLARALVELNAVSQLWATGYGRALVAKTLLFGALLMLGWRSRRALADRGRLRRGVALELGLLVLLVLAVAVLTALRPGRDAFTPPPSGVREVGRAPAQPSDAVVFAGEAGDLAVGLAVEPGAPLRLTATILGQSGNGVDGLSVQLSAGNPSRSVTDVAQPCGHGCYTSALSLGSPRRFNVTISGSGLPRVLTFPVAVPWPPPSGTAFLIRATRAFADLQSVVYREHLASDPTHAITSTWKLVAPDRVAYAVDDGSQGIVIGRRRWDRSAPGAPWTLSASVLLSQPSAPWGTRFDDVHVVRESRSAQTLSWVDPAIPAWYSATFDRSSGRPRTLKMTASAHFMQHAYLAYDTPVRIAAPGRVAR